MAGVLVDAGTRLNRPDPADLSREAAGFLCLITARGGNGGCKWPMIVSYDTDSDGVSDAHDEFDGAPDEIRDTGADGMGDDFERLIKDDDPNDPVTGFAAVPPGVDVPLSADPLRRPP